MEVCGDVEVVTSEAFPIPGFDRAISVGMIPQEASIAFNTFAGPGDRLLTAATREDCEISFEVICV